MRVTRDALAEGVDPLELNDNYMVPVTDEVGRLFEFEEYFVPELLLSRRSTKGSLEFLRPLLAAAGAEPGGPRGDCNGEGRSARYRQEPRRVTLTMQ